MNFRQTIKQNNRRTQLVILTYLLIMCVVGLLADVVAYPPHPDSLSLSLLSYLTLEKTPIVTPILLGITLVGIFLLSRFGHKLMLASYESQELNGDTASDDEERQLVNVVEEMAISANLGYVPKLYLLETSQPNAFAAGWNKHNGLIGVTRGLLDTLNRAETQAVIAHEIGHIIHGDSKLTLYIGILANVILTFTNIITHIFYIFGRGKSSAANKAKLIIFILNLVLPIITKILYFYLSRTREYMADAAAVKLTGDPQAMVDALDKISRGHERADDEEEDEQPIGDHYRSAAYIFNKGDSWFSTHPSIENRITKILGER
jgi:heat shock protein HtpX